MRGQSQQTQKGGTEWSKSKKKGEDYLENSNWISPVPLRTDKSALPDFPLTCLPLVPQAMAVGVAETTSTDISMSATALLSALSFCFSGVYRMFGKAEHSEPLTLYSLILANPAERKSPVMRFVKSPFLSFAEDFPEGVTVETPNGEQVEPVTDAEGNVIENPDDTSEGEKDDKTEKNEGKGGGNNTLLILVGVLTLAGGGAFYYFKVYKAKPKAPKQSLYDEDEEDYEEETVNEDTVDEEADEDEE